MTNKSNADSGFFTAIWKILASVKLTVSLLLMLATTSVVGTLIPQNAEPMAYIRAYGDFVYRILHVFDLFDMYYSWWFRTLILLLAANIMVCTIKRWPAIWRAITSKSPQFGSVANKKPLQEISDSREPHKLIPTYLDFFKKHYRTVNIEPEKERFRITVEKGRWSRLGVPVVHLSVVIVLVGALVGSLFGFDGYANIPEKGSINRIELRNSKLTLPLGFTVRCDDFDVSFYDSGSPKEFRSRLVIEEDGKRVLEKDIIVNDPLRYKGINFFQSSYGPMSPVNLDLSFTPKDSGKPFRRTVSIGQSVELPAEGGRFTVRDYKRDYHFKGTEVGEAITGVLDRAGQEPKEVVLPLRFPTFDKMRKGEWIIAVERYDNKYYTGLQVTKDPGVWMVYTGFTLLILGCWVAFFVSHQKIVVEVSPNSNSSRISVFGSTNRNRIGFEINVHKMTKKLLRI